MDARFVEKFLEDRLKRLLGKQVLLTRGPMVVSKFSGIRPEVYCHVSQLEDFGGVTAEGAMITRRPVKGPSSFKGFQEERPGRLIITVVCLSGSYDVLQELLETVSPTVLLGLELLPGFSLGSLPKDTVQLRFDEFHACLSSAEIKAERDGEQSYFLGTLIFHLDGFIHVRVTERDGLVGKSTLKAEKVLRKPGANRAQRKSGKT
ncbi:MAG: hypothetical protein NPIRA04_30140 [Nitrospirales bacterium]|nr:MAG: hypothetical protein NPIRA04_30140 [Nitrospirales bacterium]